MNSDQANPDPEKGRRDADEEQMSLFRQQLMSSQGAGLMQGAVMVPPHIGVAMAYSQRFWDHKVRQIHSMDGSCDIIDLKTSPQEGYTYNAALQCLEMYFDEHRPGRRA